MSYIPCPPALDGPRHPWEKDELVLRTRVYIEPPKTFGISGCPQCKLAEVEWSEYQHFMWCPKCLFDFRPKDAGVFDGPVPIGASELMGIYFDMLNLETNEIEPGPNEILHFKFNEDKTKVQFIPLEERAISEESKRLTFDAMLCLAVNGIGPASEHEQHRYHRHIETLRGSEGTDQQGGSSPAVGDDNELVGNRPRDRSSNQRESGSDLKPGE